MYKEDVVYIHTRILASHKNNEILPILTTWMDLEGIMLSEICYMDKDKHHVISLTHGLQKKKKTK